MNDFVILPWVADCTYKQQSALFSALRGPDNQFNKQVKKLSKFIRQATQYNADIESGYMEDTWLQLDTKQLERELEFCTLHYIAHLIEGLVIIERYTDKESDCLFASETLTWFEQTFHLSPRKVTA